MGVVPLREAAPFPCTEDAEMEAEERELAEAAAGLTVEDVRWLEENGMLPDVQEVAIPSPADPAQQVAVAPARRAGQRRRRRPRHEWPDIGTILEADYLGQHYEAEVIAAARNKSGKAIRILSGPAAGNVCRSPSGAMLQATQAQRTAHDLGRTGVANGWEFWKVKD
jgi:hypothetical protein